MSMTARQAGKVLEAFPLVDPGLVPFGERVLVQLRTPKTTSAAGIVLPKDTRETEKWNIQVGKIVAMGPTAFKNRDSMEQWPEGKWAQEGEFVRVPKYGGDRWAVPIPGKRGADEEDFALFVIFKDLELIGLITGDPLSVIAFI